MLILSGGNDILIPQSHMVGLINAGRAAGTPNLIKRQVCKEIVGITVCDNAVNEPLLWFSSRTKRVELRSIRNTDEEV
ncbi:UNVERIFIED_CONTAM: hypothetical protein HDU68_007262 [Siphonaria sp. JEL0065]|nr:hypothetical protein HDU68_007262 [Siphonaria sp. JEL0065]